MKVKLHGEIKSKVNVFLVIPSYKVFTGGGLLDNKEDWGFYHENGKIFLPQGVKAFVIAVSETDGKLYFGRTDFVTSLSQNIEISLTENNKENVLKSLEVMKNNPAIYPMIDSLPIHDSISKSMKKIDDELFKISNRITNCSCETRPVSSK